MGIFDWIRLILGCSFIICGLVIFFTEIFGVFHFQYVLNRMHATAMGDTLGIASCMLGLVIFSGFNMTSVKILLIVIFLWFASPVSSHVLARLEVATNENLESRCKVYTDLETLEKELADTATVSETAQQSETGGKEL
ncbi:MAG: monovalent cation/H(+) antiporter subunit G [Lachnospiraceae bacterium]|nr:monovalent cation/H(+) antiporter subunit G [Lachnospiraceae bacterium]